MEPIFTENQFVNTKWTTAAEKARFANHFVRFVSEGYKPRMFCNWFYLLLRNSFRHIAHFNKEGFYNTWFSDTVKQADFLFHCVTYMPTGRASHTFSDVEKRLIAWIKRSGSLEAARAAASVTKQETDITLRDQLLFKYPLAEYPMETDIPIIL